MLFCGHNTLDFYIVLWSLKMDVRKFINAVFGRKCLWDQSDPSYHLRDSQRKAWREVAEEMEISVDELKKKWRGLRDTFGKELRKFNYKKSDHDTTEPHSKWPYFKNLLFLRSAMSRRDLKSSVADICEISYEEDGPNPSTINQANQTSTSSNYNNMPSPFPDQSSEVSDEQTPRKPFKSQLKKKIKRIQDEDTRLLEIEAKLKFLQRKANDPDAQFLMSLLPFLKDVPKHRKLVIRAKLQQVLIDEQNAM